MGEKCELLRHGIVEDQIALIVPPDFGTIPSACLVQLVLYNLSEWECMVHSGVNWLTSLYQRFNAENGEVSFATVISFGADQNQAAQKL